MGVPLARVKTWTAEILTANDLNAEFNNIINNLDPDSIDDASSDLTAMRATADPYPASSESQATDLRTELKQIRYQLDLIIGGTYWYEDPASSLASSLTGPGASVTDNTVVRFDGTGGLTSQASNVVIDDSDNVSGVVNLSVGNVSVVGNVAVGDGSAADNKITVNADTGDASLILQVNNSSANAWTVVLDNSDSDKLTFEYGGSEKFGMTTGGILTGTQIDVTGTIDTNGACQASYFLPDGDDSSAPGANRLYKANVPKAWAHCDVGLSGTVTITDDHNVSSASYSAENLTVSWDTIFANSTYFAKANYSTVSGGTATHINAQAYSTGSTVFEKGDTTTGNADAWLNGEDAEFFAIGDQ